MKLSAQDVFVVARRGEWKLDVNLGALDSANSAIYFGDGVDDLDRVSAIIASGTNHGARLLIDVGAHENLNPGPDFAAQWRFFDQEDLAAIRAKFVELNGPVNKPDEYQPKPGVAVPV